MRGTMLVAVLLTLCGCDEVAGNEAYWLEQRSLSSEWYRVVRVFGYANNEEGCNDIAEAMRSRVASAPKPAQFRCVPD